MEKGPAIKWLCSGGQESYNYEESLWCTLPWFFTYHYDMDIPFLEVRCDKQLYPLSPSLLFILWQVYSLDNRDKKEGWTDSVRNKPSSFSEAGRKALPLACHCLSERKARRPGVRCPLSVHTLPSAASCFVTQHDSMGYRDGGALRSAADQLTWIKRNFLY